MKRAVRPHRDAELELVDAIEWYEREREGLGRELWDEVQRGIAMIAANPEIGGLIRQTKVSPPVRRVPLRRFPHFIIYREREADLQIPAFAHMSSRDIGAPGVADPASALPPVECSQRRPGHLQQPSGDVTPFPAPGGGGSPGRSQTAAAGRS